MWDFSVIADYSDTAECVFADNMTLASWELIAVITDLKKLQIEKCTCLLSLICVWSYCTQMCCCVAMNWHELILLINILKLSIFLIRKIMIFSFIYHIFFHIIYNRFLLFLICIYLFWSLLDFVSCNKNDTAIYCLSNTKLIY